LTDYIPDIGDVVELDLTYQAGIETTGEKRQALVLSRKIFNKKGYVVLCPIEDNSLNSLYEVSLPDEEPIKGFIQYNQVKTLDWKTRNSVLICKLSDVVVETVKNKIELLL
jgi:mRNA interferase MazF